MFSKQQKWGMPLLFLTLFIGAVFSVFSINTASVSGITQDSVKIPENSEDFKNAGNNFMSAFPEALNNTWKEALSFWEKAGNRLREFWDQAVSERVRRLVDRFSGLIGKEGAIREPIIKDEFEKEKTEMKDSIDKDLPPVTKSIWDTLRELFSR